MSDSTPRLTSQTIKERLAKQDAQIAALRENQKILVQVLMQLIADLGS